MPTRRQFLRSMSLPAVGAVGALPILDLRSVEGMKEWAQTPGTPEAIARDEDFWFEVSRAFTVDRSLVNFNNGGVSPSPKWVQDAMKRHLDFSNVAPPYTMWRILDPQVEPVRERLAREFGCETEELAITRNASEGLQICQFGVDLKSGDEILTTEQDYPRMLTAFRQRVRREDLKLVMIPVPVATEDPDRIAAAFEERITDRTRLILACHVINLTGQVLPIEKIVAIGRRRGIPVIVDGAHALAHLVFRLKDLDCDYYATSLHKWLFAPHGTGLLYVKRDKIESLWPLMGADPHLDGDIRKFEQIGTHPAANRLAIAEALNFHQGIGGERKLARLIYLRDYWASRLKDTPGIRMYTSLKPGHAGGIATVGIDGIRAGKLAGWLWKNHRILVTGITHYPFGADTWPDDEREPVIDGLRVSPSVYSTLEELDRFVDAMQYAARFGIEGAKQG